MDHIADMLATQDYKNFYVEIGGEVRVAGTNSEQGPWRIAVDRASPDARPGQDTDEIVGLRNKAMATSGDYRNFFAGKDGLLFSHILDPRTGRPVTNGVAAVSVIADTCMLADGMATALMVMGPKDGLAWVEKKENVEALFVTRSKDGTLHKQSSTGFDEFLLQP